MDEPLIVRNGESYDLGTREHMDNGVYVQMCPNDTREKLENDVRSSLGFTVTDVFGWLDRQAAITTKAMQDYVNRKLSIRGWKAQMDKLQAERDELQAAIDAMGNGQFYAMYLKACEERDHYKDMVQESAERICVPHGEWERMSQTQEFRRMYCDCGYELGMDRHETFPYEHRVYYPMPYFCPECGARIVSKANAVTEE